MPRALRLALGLLAGYASGAALGWLAVQFFSSNAHDKALEAAMTAAFVAGPAGAVVGLVAAWMTSRTPKS